MSVMDKTEFPPCNLGQFVCDVTQIGGGSLKIVMCLALIVTPAFSLHLYCSVFDFFLLSA